jgi:peptidoglycan/xylan/chitin deacetylase (PgdA/CDA1 family)
MIRRATRAALKGALRQVARLPLTRRAMHGLSVLSRGSSVAFLRCRRVLPDTALTRDHPDRRSRVAMTPAQLERALLDAQKTLRFIHLAEALRLLRAGQRLSESAAVLTFDESFAATAEMALPVLRKLQIPAVIFVSTAYLDGHSVPWDMELHHLLSASAPRPLSVSWIDSVLRTNHPAERVASARRLLLHLTALDEGRRAERMQELREKVDAPNIAGSVDRMLSADEVVQVVREPWITVASHGHHHWPLNSLSTDDELQLELTKSRSLLREVAGPAYVDAVSYPFGHGPFVSDAVAEAAARAGYQAGFTASSGVARPGDHLFRLPRLMVAPGISGMDAYELQGMHDAVDELLLVATGSEERLAKEIEG